MPVVVGSRPSPSSPTLPIVISREPRVQFLWWSGCPSWERSLARLREEMAALGLDPATIEMHEVETNESAEREGFVGSPTIRVDGRDVQPLDDQPVGLTCRVYRLRDGRISPLPDPADLRDLLGAGTAPTDDERTRRAGGEPERTSRGGSR